MSPSGNDSGLPAPSLTSLPTELQLNIISNLDTMDSQFLRSTNRYFHSLIPKAWPTRDDLRNAEEEYFAKFRRLLYCNPCNRLRHFSKFSIKMQRTSEQGNKGGNYSRSCMDCGVLPFKHDVSDMSKYHIGDRWESEEGNHSVFTVRCLRCHYCRESPRTPEPNEHEFCSACVPTVRQERQNADERERAWRAEQEEQYQARLAQWEERQRQAREVGGPNATAGEMRPVMEDSRTTAELRRYNPDRQARNRYRAIESERNLREHALRARATAQEERVPALSRRI